jgi:hypothetical protein
MRTYSARHFWVARKHMYNMRWYRIRGDAGKGNSGEAGWKVESRGNNSGVIMWNKSIRIHAKF